jgi:DNA modification methylase
MDNKGIDAAHRKMKEHQKKKQHSRESDVPMSLKIFNLWNFRRCDERYGTDYPGRIPGQIIENVLYYYTKLGDTVVDPMAGGGTTLDVCKAMGRQHCCYDIQPKRDDIEQHDITNGFPIKCSDCDLVFLDPPYWKQKKGDYSDGRTNLANYSLPEFYDQMKVIFNGARDVLKPRGHIAVIIGPTQEKGIIYDHAFIFQQMMPINMKFISRIIVPYTTQQAKPYHITDAKKGHYMLKLYRDLLIWQKE